MRHREQPATNLVTRYFVVAPAYLLTPTHPVWVFGMCLERLTNNITDVTWLSMCHLCEKLCLEEHV